MSESAAQPVTAVNNDNKTTTNDDSSSLIPHFQPTRILNQDQSNRRLILHGTLHSQPSILIIERTPIPSTLSTLPTTLKDITLLGQNDIYSWHLASSCTAGPDVKLNLIHPCTPTHIAKYTSQGLRLVTETPHIYRMHVRPYMQRWREEDGGRRLAWVWNILDDGDNRAVGERVLARGEGFVLVADLNWDGRSLGSLHLLALVERRDIWSLRDLKRGHVRWLEGLREKVLDAAMGLGGLFDDDDDGEKGEDRIERDQLKMYVHYQPTYYHFHIHVVNVALEAGATQATGKAFGLENIISQLKSMTDADGGDEKGMADVDITYTIGEESDIWKEVFGPLKEKRKEKGGEREGA